MARASLLIVAAMVLGTGAPQKQGGWTFHLLAQQRTGILIPLYVYPGDALRNPHFRRVMELKRRFETVPFWVILNPASGPGKREDPNYTRAIRLLAGAGCVTLGYVTTGYAKRPAGEVDDEASEWQRLYPLVNGIFFDEMVYEDTAEGARYQAERTEAAHRAGFWPVVANPGADTPGRYLAERAADVFVIHEGGEWPSEERLRGERPGGYAEHAPFTRGILVHSQERLNAGAVRMARQHVRWIYATEGIFRPGDPSAANPWDRASRHLESLCRLFAREDGVSEQGAD